MSDASSQPTTVCRVFALEGGGMRGIYTAAYLEAMLTSYEKIRHCGRIDLGKACQLIAGTSTGAIVAAALAADVPLDKVIALYRDKGPGIFPEKIPASTLGVLMQVGHRSRINREGAAALKAALTDALGDVTIGQVWSQRRIALAFPTVEMSHHRAWVFKTPHLANSKDRDGNFTLVDACMATSAAPIYRSLHQVQNPDGPGTFTFVDGGLWANNPILVGLIDALGMTQDGDTIEIFCLGTCPPPSGDQIAADEVDRGLKEWRFGGDVPGVAISAQQFAYDHMARMLAPFLKRKISIVRFPTGEVPPSLQNHLALDETSPKSLDALVSHAQTDAHLALSHAGDAANGNGRLIDNLFRTAPEAH